MHNTALRQSVIDHTRSDSISAGMDGELDDLALTQLIRLCKAETADAAQWRTYHIIGDTLRQTPLTSNQLSEKIRRHLADEPTLLAPQRQRGLGKFVMPIAASVTAILLVSWSAVNLPTTHSRAPMLADALPMQQTQIDQTKLASFIAAHRNFSPGPNSPFMDATYQIPAEPTR